MEKKFIRKEKGITLIALIITIIVLLILAGISLQMSIGENGVLNRASSAKSEHTIGEEKEQISLSYNAGKLENNGGVVTEGQIEKELKNYDKGATVTTEGDNFKIKFSTTGHVYTLAKEKISGPIEEEVVTDGIKVTVDGKTETLTKDNFGDYLGKKVLNFKEDNNSKELIDDRINVSTTYRLYYIDFDNKYGEDDGIVYLKADCTDNANDKKCLYSVGEATEEGQKMVRTLNPGLYSDGKTTPTFDKNNMKGIAWLLDKNNWINLQNPDTIHDEVEGHIKYIVGGPSLEMMMDSYNTCYHLLNKELEVGNCTEESDRKKLFCEYTSGRNGFYVGPGSSSEYEDATANYTVKTDTIDTMYYPGDNRNYWLASPSDYNAWNNSVCSVWGKNGGYVGSELALNFYYGSICPLACLDSSVELELE